MSRYAASPSPSDALYQAPHHHSGRNVHSRGQCGLDDEDGAGSDAVGSGGNGGHEDGAWGGDPHSCSASPQRTAASQPLPMRMSSSRPRSRSGSLGMRQQHRRWPHGEIPVPPSPPLLADDAAEPGHRYQHSRRRRDGRSRSRHQRVVRERDRDHRQRHWPARTRGRNYARKLAASQAPMHMAMVQGMMHPLQLAMMQQMGMVPPAYLAAMQQPPGAAQALSRSMMFDGRAGASSSSSSESSDSESSGDESGVMHPAAAMAAMAAMWPGAAAAAAGGVEPGGGPNIEAFLAACPVDPEAADRLRALPPPLQQSVMRRGPLSETRNPSAVLIARVRDVEPAVAPSEYDRSAASDERGPKPARRSAKVTIEAMIRDYRLSPGCAWMLRALPPDKQKLAARIDPAGQTDPSGYVAEQLKRIV